VSAAKILPGTGRWQREALTEGARLGGGATTVGPLHHPPSLPLRRAVPLPVPGRI
jgi:hypothetical protein